jgi:hypothetical protein
MATEAVLIDLDPRAAQILRSATPDTRRKLEALISLHLLEAGATQEPLETLMRRISQNAQKRGLTPEILAEILDDHS